MFNVNYSSHHNEEKIGNTRTFTFNHNFVLRIYCSYLVLVRNLMIFEDSHEKIVFKLFYPMDILVVCYVQAIETNSIKNTLLWKFTPFYFSYFFLSNSRKLTELYKKYVCQSDITYKKLNRSVLYTPSSTKQWRKLWYKNNYHI